MGILGDLDGDFSNDLFFLNGILLDLDVMEEIIFRVFNIVCM